MEKGKTTETSEPGARRSGLRFGSFVTIAVALLLLFGAASRMGKTPETAALFGIDQTAEQRIGQELTRLKAALTLGATPAGPGEEIRSGGALPVNPNVLPPHRQEVDIDALRQVRAGRHAAMSLGVREDTRPGSHQVQAPQAPGAPVEYEDDVPTVRAQRPAAEQPAPGPSRRPSEYTVVKGDTWNKVATKTLGDGKRWQEIMRANPKAKNGLQVGMRLTIP